MAAENAWQQTCFARLDALLAKTELAQEPQRANWTIGLSGGLDSCVLLHLLQSYRQAQSVAIDLSAIHINHAISSNAEDWQNFCAWLCQELAVPFKAVVLDSTLASKSNLEAEARSARYSAFEQIVPAGATLFLAHHQNDQAETFLYRALRGGGSSALAAIPAQRALGQAQLVRPLLSASRAQLETYARQHGLTWVEDESNQDTNYDRNYLRQEVIPTIESRWPQAVKTLSRSAEIAAQTDRLAQDLAELDLAALDCQAHWGALSIELSAVTKLAKYRQANVLRQMAKRQGLTSPKQQQLDALLTQLEQQQELGVDWGDGFYRQSFGRVFCSPRLEQLSGSLGQLELSSAVIDDDVIKAMEQIYRQGGERLAWADGHSRSLKKLMIEWQIPSWWRARYPIIHYQGLIIAVPGFYYHPEWSALDCRWL